MTEQKLISTSETTKDLCARIHLYLFETYLIIDVSPFVWQGYSAYQ